MWLTTDELDFVYACASVDLNANTTAFPCRTVNMGRYESMVACVQMGAGSTYEIYVQCATTATGITGGSTGNMVPYNYRVSGSAANASTCDTLCGRAAVASTDTTGWSHDATSAPNVTAYLEVKSQDVPEGYPYVGVVISTAAQAHPASVLYVCKPRYANQTMLIAMS
jgi:hypothetical protein